MLEQQFFDSAPHNPEVNVSSQPQAKDQFLPLEIVKGIEVAEVAPLLSISLSVFADFTSLLILGLLFGLGLKKKRV
jgi:hypothetical protein